MDSYAIAGTLLSIAAAWVLYTRRPSSSPGQKSQLEMMQIQQQMLMYKKQSQELAERQKESQVVEDESKFAGGRVTILFGSQTGTAEGFAQMLKKEGRKHGFFTQMIDLEEYDPEQQLSEEHCVIFLMATYGEGDPTDNAIEFNKFIRGKSCDLDESSLKDVPFTVFGLGNRQYEHYNTMGKLVNDRMEKYGAKRVYKYGEGDDDGSLDEDFDDWKEGLWKALRMEFLPDSAADIEPTDTAEDGTSEPVFEFECIEIEEDELDRHARKSSEAHIKSLTKHFVASRLAKVVVNREVRQSTELGSTVHMEIDLEGTGMSYVTADNLAVLPENLTSVVNRLAARMKWNLDQLVAITPVDDENGGQVPFPSPCTVRDILMKYLAINGNPRKGPLKQLAYYAQDKDERQELIRLAGKDGKDEYQKWVVADERSFVDIIEHYESIDLSLKALLHIVPFMMPRYYTISSSSLVHPNRIHATVSIIRNEKEDGRVFQGVASTYLGNLTPKLEAGEAPVARIFTRASSFRLPSDPKTPIIMIGPGTGIAPMRAFLQERAKQKEDGLDVGRSILYFGCRRRDEDFIYRDELEKYEADGVLTDMHLAFSREQQEKVYVQHLMKQNAADLWRLMDEEKAHIYVCGATTMGNDVNKVLDEVLQEFGGKSKDEAAAYLKKLQKEERYVQELWS